MMTGRPICLTCTIAEVKTSLFPAQESEWLLPSAKLGTTSPNDRVPTKSTRTVPAKPTGTETLVHCNNDVVCSSRCHCGHGAFERRMSVWLHKWMLQEMGNASWPVATKKASRDAAEEGGTVLFAPGCPLCACHADGTPACVHLRVEGSKVRKKALLSPGDQTVARTPKTRTSATPVTEEVDVTRAIVVAAVAAAVLTPR